jgi:putative ABC transport system permease protein
VLRLILRWSRRDLRARWVQVLAVSLIIALGAGAYAGLRSTTAIREVSIYGSFAASNFLDLRVRLASGDFVSEGEMLSTLRQAASYDAVVDAEERLIFPTQVEAQSADGEVFVAGRVISITPPEEPAVNAVHVMRGEYAEGAALIEYNFAEHYGLPAAGTIRIAGGQSVAYSGQALLPEYFIVNTDEGGAYAQASFAVIGVDLATAQQLAGRPGAVNDLILTLGPGADREALKQELRDLFPTATVLDRDEDRVYRMMTEDVNSDEQAFTVIAVSILAGAIFAAYNFTSRMIESQRREFGIAMALGLHPATIALRPLVFGIQVAVIGVLLAVGVALLLASAITSLYRSILPLPIWEAEFQTGDFLQAAILGFLAPLVAILIPVWRAVSVLPIEAIRTSHVSSGRSSSPGGRLLRRLQAAIPGDTFWQMPVRNLIRAPRRTLLSVVGIATALAVLLAISGILDSFLGALDQAEDHLLADRPDRMTIGFNQLEAAGSPAVQAVLGSSAVKDAETGVRVEGRLQNGNETLDVLLQFVDMESDLWQPSLDRGTRPAGAGGGLLADKAARDLGVGVGDEITVLHPVLTPDGSYAARRSTLTVAGIHGGPYRFDVYLDLSALTLLGAEGMANVVWAEPADGLDANAARRELFTSTTAGSIVPVSSVTDGFRDIMLQSTGLFRIAQFLMLLIAGLVAFNLSSISMEERTREHATMLAFGVPVAKVLRMSVFEALIVGVIATVIGSIGGYLFLVWLMTELFPRQMPDMGLSVIVSPDSLIITVAIGVVVVAAAPLLLVRRLRGMDVPGSLKVRE